MFVYHDGGWIDSYGSLSFLGLEFPGEFGVLYIGVVPVLDLLPTQG